MIHITTLFQQKYKNTYTHTRMNSALPRIQYLHHVTADCFAFLQGKKNFSLVVLYTQQGEVYLEYDGLMRQLPTSRVGEEKELLEKLYSSIDQHNGDHTNNISQGNHHHTNTLKPILLIENTLCYKRNAHTVYGIVYAMLREGDVSQK